MKRQLAPQPHPASCAEAWENGWPKRPPNFDELVARAEAWRWQPDQTLGRAAAVVATSTWFLNSTQRCVLLLYVESLNTERLPKSNAFVWYSVRTTAHMLGLSVRSVRDANSALEHAGFIIRSYNYGNRPSREQAWSLAPLMARLDELEEAREARVQVRRAEATAWQDNVVMYSAAQGAEGRRLEQSPSNSEESVRGSAAPTARNQFDERQAPPAALGETSAGRPQPHATPQDQQGSPRGEVSFGSAQPAPSVGARALQAQLAAALEVCPELQEYVPASLVVDPSSATPADLRRVADAAQDLLPEPERNNRQTAMWGLQRHGILTIVMLALALKGRRIQSPNAYFAHLALSEPSLSLDFSLNLARLLPDTGKVPIGDRTPAKVRPPERPPLSAEAAASVIAPPGGDHPTWLAIAAVLQRRLRTGAFQTWFAKVGFHGIHDGELRLSANPTAADKLRNEFARPIAEAAEAAGFGVLRPSIRPRTVDNPAPWSEETS